MKENPAAFKHLINSKLVKKIAKRLFQVWPNFDYNSFVQVSKKLKPLELKPRVQIIRDALFQHLPPNYITSLQILMKSLNESDLKGFDLWPYTEFIQTYGLNEPTKSLEALSILTTKFTSEFAIRPFIIKYPQETFTKLLEWSHDPNVHIRRWTSEGTRPRLPWGIKLRGSIENPKNGLRLLNNLKFDEELYVRKSVANHLNDIAKDHPDLVIKTLKQWRNQVPLNHVKKLNWVQKQALRTLIKNGYKPALNLIGCGQKPKIKVGTLIINKRIFQINDILQFKFEIKSKTSRTQKLAIDYVVHFQKSNQKLSPKVFKIKVIDLKPNEIYKIQKNHSLKPVTTRRYYSGEHKIQIQINGELVAEAFWHLNLN